MKTIHVDVFLTGLVIGFAIAGFIAVLIYARLQQLFTIKRKPGLRIRKN